MKLSLAFSPCPNDTFIFDALVHRKIDTGYIEFEVVLEDVETLNKLALQNIFDITKLSYYAYTYASRNYILLTSGSALGKGCGPLVISKDIIPANKIEYCVTGIPGRLTTANFLFSLAFPRAIIKKELVFSEIEDELILEKIDLGVIIHENRFTYQQKGLKKIADLGAWWQHTYNLPIPLGGMAMKRNFDPDLISRVNELIKKSILFALNDGEQAMDYVRMHAQEMDAHVMQQHIDLYVNDFTVNLGDEGKNAVNKMFAVAKENNIISFLQHPAFI